MPEKQLSWFDAIKTVLAEANEPMSPAEIADEVVERGLRTELGATPSATIGSRIYTSLKTDGINSPFVRAGKARFMLRSGDAAVSAIAEQAAIEKELTESTAETTGLVNALGMFWEYSKVDWERTEPHLYGQQQIGSQKVDFCAQRGVYLLHDRQGVIYVGRVKDRSLGRRLYEHTRDRLRGRWSRFSWFGVYPVEENGSLKTDFDFSHVDIETVIVTMEAVLIEGLEPRQNRKRGDEFRAVEFIQVEAPELENQRKLALLQEMVSSITK